MVLSRSISRCPAAARPAICLSRPPIAVSCTRMRSRISRHISAWCPVNRPSSAIDRSASFPAARARPLAGSAITLPRRSPSISASVIAAGPLPVMSEATEPGLMPAGSSVLSSRWIPQVRARTVFDLYRVRSRTSLSSAAGM